MAVGRMLKLVRAESDKNVRGESYQTAPQPVVSSTPDLRKGPREPIVSRQDTAAKKSEVKRPKASTKKEEWLEVPKPGAEKPEPPKRSEEGRGRLDSALKEVIGASGSVRHFISTI